MITGLRIGLNPGLRAGINPSEEGDYMLVSRAVMAEDGQSLAVSGLDGDAHGLYHVQGRILLPSATAQEVAMRPNGSSSNLEGRYILNAGSAVAASDWVLVGGISTGFTGPPLEFGFSLDFAASKTLNGETVYRWMKGAGILMSGATGLEDYGVRFYGGWVDSATALASLSVESSVAGGVLAGSEVVVYRHSTSFGA